MEGGCPVPSVSAARPSADRLFVIEMDMSSEHGLEAHTDSVVGVRTSNFIVLSSRDVTAFVTVAGTLAKRTLATLATVTLSEISGTFDIIIATVSPPVVGTDEGSTLSTTGLPDSFTLEYCAKTKNYELFSAMRSAHRSAT